MFSPTSIAGVYTALVTPFSEAGASVDFEALDSLVEGQIAARVAGLVPCRTTGEAPTMSAAEQRQVIERTGRAARGRVPAVAGTGSFSPPQTVLASQAAP